MLDITDGLEDLPSPNSMRGEPGIRDYAHLYFVDEPGDKNPRRLQFFREYFGYPRALDFFKDPPVAGKHDAAMLLDDLEYLIRHILDEDRDLLRTLLTTNEAFVIWSVDTELGAATSARPELGRGRRESHGAGCNAL